MCIPKHTPIVVIPLTHSTPPLNLSMNFWKGGRRWWKKLRKLPSPPLYCQPPLVTPSQLHSQKEYLNRHSGSRTTTLPPFLSRKCGSPQLLQVVLPPLQLGSLFHTCKPNLPLYLDIRAIKSNFFNPWPPSPTISATPRPSSLISLNRHSGSKTWT